MQSSASQVIIVGAGPVGLGLALALARQGVRSVVLEQNRTVEGHIRASVLLPRTMEIMAQWQAADALRQVGTTMHSLAPWWPGDVRPLCRLPMTALCGPGSQSGGLVLPQGRTEDVLAQAVAEVGASEIRRGHRLLGFEPIVGGVRCSIQPENGAVYGLEGQFLIGCDGRQSAVRRQLGWTLQGDHETHRHLAADVRVPDSGRDALPSPRLLMHGDCVTVAHRVAANLWRLTAALGRHESCAQALQQAALRGRFESVMGAGPWRLLWADTFAMQGRCTAQVFAGRVVLAGDAARIRDWGGSQGLNLGLHDVHNLAWKLARGCNGADAGSTQTLLEAYQSERRDADIVDPLAALLRLRGLPMLRPLLAHGLTRRLVGQGLRLALAQPGAQRWLVHAAGFTRPTYAQSSLVLGTHKLAGALAPNDALENDHGATQYLLAGLYGHALLVLFDAGAGAQVLPALRHGLAGIEGVVLRRVVPASGRAGPMSLRDVHGTAWAAWGALDGMVALVRPDGHIGWISTMPPSSEAVWTHVRHALGMPPKPLKADSRPPLAAWVGAQAPRRCSPP